MLIYLVGWYVAVYSPHIPELNKLSENGRKSIFLLEDRLYKIVTISEKERAMRSYALRNAYNHLVLKNNYKGMLSWHLNTTLWFFASYIHLNDKEAFFIWCKFLTFEKDLNLTEASNFYLKKDISQLNNKELVTLITIAKSPKYYKIGNDRLTKQVNLILEKLNSE